MDEALHSILARWGEFYVIMGAAASALTGLQFVVQTLIADRDIDAISDDPEGGIAAFSTPTVVHFTLALVLSGILCAPWPNVRELQLTLGALGVGAIVYALIVLRRAWRIASYKPVLEDWIWHIMLPFVAYVGVLVTAVWLGTDEETPLFVAGAATLLLVCIGIHNAWDTVTWVVVRAVNNKRTGQDTPAHAPVPQRPAPPKKRGRRRG